VRTAEAVAANIDRILRGEPAVNFVNFSQPRMDLRKQANGSCRASLAVV
jgi:hypothetical protein